MTTEIYTDTDGSQWESNCTAASKLDGYPNNPERITYSMHYETLVGSFGCVHRLVLRPALDVSREGHPLCWSAARLKTASGERSVSSTCPSLTSSLRLPDEEHGHEWREPRREVVVTGDDLQRSMLAERLTSLAA